MTFSAEIQETPVDAIKILRPERQRQSNLDTSDLDESIRRRGIMNPIIITREMVLVAGERRLIAAKKLGFLSVPTRFFDQISRTDAKIVELEENLKRKDLHWIDLVRATTEIHTLYLAENPSQTITDTAEAIGMGAPWTSQVLRVGRDIDQERVRGASSLTAAYNMLTRVDDRAMADALSDILETGKDAFDPPEEPAPVPGETSHNPGGMDAPPTTHGAPTAPPRPEKRRIVPAESSILNESFLEWAPKWEGRPFNFIHCDFPFGINYNSGEQSGKNEWENYNDSPDVYWALCKCLCENLDRLMSHSAHLLFWYSFDYHQETLEFFRQNAPSLVFRKRPLIWLKSDNVGILPDPRRGPRQIFETALMAAREDRLIVKAVSDAHSSHTDKTLHQSTKPEPMLRHFMQMFVDQNTRLLDPTCGSGAALRAAESLGAEQVLGLELSPDHCAGARTALRQFRVLREATK